MRAMRNAPPETSLKFIEPEAEIEREIARAERTVLREVPLRDQKQRMGLFIRTIGLARARLKVGMVNLAYNMRRMRWLEAREAPA